jgi:hypothetical protein
MFGLNPVSIYFLLLVLGLSFVVYIVTALMRWYAWYYE